MKKIFPLLLLMISLWTACQHDKDLDLLSREIIGSDSIETLKDELSDEAIYFFELDYISTQHPNIKNPDDDGILDTTVSTRDESKRTTLIERAYYNLLQQNQAINFVPQVIEEIGYPIWDKAILAETDGADFNSLVLPFAKLDHRFITSVVLINFIEEEPVFFVRADKSLVDTLVQNIHSSQASTEELPFHLAAYLELDEHVFGTKDQDYVDWLEVYNEGELTDQGQASSRCITGTTTLCYYVGCAFEDSEEASQRCETCVTVSINCDSYDGDNGSIGGTIPSGISFPNSDSGGGGSNEGASNSSSSSVEVFLFDCEVYINNQNELGVETPLDEEQQSICVMLDAILNVVLLGENEIEWLIHPQHTSYLSGIYTYINAGNTDSDDAQMLLTYIQMMSRELIEEMYLLPFIVEYQKVYGTLHPYMGLSLVEGAHLINHPATTDELVNYFEREEALLVDVEPEIKEEILTIASQSANMILRLDQHDLIDGPYEDDFYEIADEFLEEGHDPVIFALMVSWEYGFIKLDHPDWSDTWALTVAIKRVLMERIHMGLDVAGMIPGAGEVFDMTNGVLYTLEGEYGNAALSATAMIPAVGWFSTSAKWSRKAIPGKRFKLKFFKHGNKVVFPTKNSLYSQLRETLNTPTGYAAHHIIPLEFTHSATPNELLQIDAKGAGKDAWHPNELANGINVLNARHNSNHPDYSLLIEHALQDIMARHNNNISPENALKEVRELMDRVRAAINANPNTPINEIFF